MNAILLEGEVVRLVGIYHVGVIGGYVLMLCYVSFKSKFGVVGLIVKEALSSNSMMFPFWLKFLELARQEHENSVSACGIVHN